MEDRLQKFAVLIETGSFTKAAAQLHVSQPGLTMAIKKLERELKVELIIRRSHPLQPTNAGSLAYAAAKKIKTESANLKLKITEASSGKTKLNLGMIDNLAETLFVQGKELNKLQKQNHLSLTINNSSLLTSQIENDTLDLAFIAGPAKLTPELSAIYLGVEPLVLVTNTQNFKHYSNCLKQSAELPNFLAYNQQSNTYKLISKHFLGNNITVKPQFYSSSPNILLEMVLGGQGVAVLPFGLIRQHLESGAIQLLPTKIIERQVFAIMRESKVLPKSAHDLMKTTQQILQHLRSQTT